MVAGKSLRQRERTQATRPGVTLAGSASAGSSDHERPTFSLHFMAGDYCVTAGDQRSQAEFALALRKRADLTWSQLRQVPHETLGYERMPRDQIRAPIPPFFAEDETPIVFRIADRGRIVGFRQDAVFHVVWVDMKFELYPH